MKGSHCMHRQRHLVIAHAAIGNWIDMIRLADCGDSDEVH